LDLIRVLVRVLPPSRDSSLARLPLHVAGGHHARVRHPLPPDVAADRPSGAVPEALVGERVLCEQSDGQSLHAVDLVGGKHFYSLKYLSN
jgi:hypothetical protein